MAKVKIQGNASGTGVITLIAPNTNTDRTVTLPDESITLAGGVAGIVSTANATAITIDSSEQVGIGVAPTVPLQIRKRLSSVGQTTPETVLLLETDAGSGDMAVGNGTRILFKISDDETNPSVGASIDAVRANGDDSISSTDLVFSTSQNDETLDEALRITNDGRGLSQFTARAWVNFNGTGTVAIRDSHNVSSISDYGTGDYGVNFSNNMANANYCAVPGGKFYSWDSSYLIESNTTGYLQIASVRSSNSTYEDTPIITATVFGD